MSLSQDIESRVAILDVVNRYVQTKKAWVNYKALCPFHHENTPSFVISPAKNIAKCFSCGKWWGPIRFLMEIEQIEFREAAGILAKEAGIELKTHFRDHSQEKWKDPYLAYKIATEWYHSHLFSPEWANALEYLFGRWLSLETIKKFSLGYSSSPRDLLYMLKDQGFEESFLVECGLFVSAARDKFFGRVIFPIANYMGNTVAFTGRILSDGQPKYLNSPTSRIFDKSSILYGLHIAKHTIMKTGEAIIVEGQMDTVALHQAWINNAVGISGTALTKEHILLLRRFTKTVYLSLDADDAGIKATFSSIANLLNSDIEIRIIVIPQWKDPDEYIKAWWDFGLLRDRSLTVIEYYLEMGSREYDLSTMIGKKQLIEKCLDLIAQISSPVETDFYIKHLSEVFDISREALYESYAAHRKQIVRARNKQEDKKSWEISVYKPSTLDLMAGYIYKYHLFDLFFAKFWYNEGQLSHIPWSRLLIDVITRKDLEDDEMEDLRTIDVYIEETYSLTHPDIIEKHFLDILREIHSLLLMKEQEDILSTISPESPEFLQAYTKIIQKSQLLGIQPGKITL